MRQFIAAGIPKEAAKTEYGAFFNRLPSTYFTTATITEYTAGMEDGEA
jgi:hypothetical protein